MITEISISIITLRICYSVISKKMNVLTFKVPLLISGNRVLFDHPV